MEAILPEINDRQEDAAVVRQDHVAQLVHEPLEGGQAARQWQDDVDLRYTRFTIAKVKIFTFCYLNS